MPENILCAAKIAQLLNVSIIDVGTPQLSLDILKPGLHP